MWGIGILPLVEIIGAIAADRFPSRNALEKEMIKMLRSFTGPAQFDNHTNLGEALASKERPGCPTVKVISIWPKFKEMTDSNTSQGSGSSGATSTSFTIIYSKIT